MRHGKKTTFIHIDTLIYIHGRADARCVTLGLILFYVRLLFGFGVEVWYGLRMGCLKLVMQRE